MSDHVEWGDVGYMTPRVEVLSAVEAERALRPEDECDRPVLTFDTGSSILAMEGTADQIIALAARIHELGMDLKHIETRPVWLG